jgi:GAF domain-containing protein
MEPIPETFEALEEFGAFLYDDDLLTELGRMGHRVQEIVPDCVGLSLAYREHGVTFTLVATDEVTAALDALQYVDDGPCIAAVDEGRVLEFTEGDVLDEARWQLFARATDAAAVASTLTLPIVVGEKVAGSVNLYASTPNAFDGKHQQLARTLGAWAEGAIANADLDFSTRRAAEDAPRKLFEETRIQVAVGILAASQDISPPVARERLREAARRAGVKEAAIARLVIEQATESRSPRAGRDADQDPDQDADQDADQDSGRDARRDDQG